jgi:hypothetical protein
VYPVYVNGDTSPPIRFRVRKGGKAQSLSGVTVTVEWKRPDASTFSKAATVTDAAKGYCQHGFTTSDLEVGGNDVNGVYVGEVACDFGGGAVQRGYEPLYLLVRAKYAEPVQP